MGRVSISEENARHVTERKWLVVQRRVQPVVQHKAELSKEVSSGAALNLSDIGRSHLHRCSRIPPRELSRKLALNTHRTRRLTITHLHQLLSLSSTS